LGAVVVVAIIVTSLRPGTAPVASFAVPSPSAPSASPTAEESTLEAVPVAIEIVGRLRERRGGLLAVLSASPFRADRIALILGQMTADVSSLVAVASRLGRDPATAAVGQPLAALAGRVQGILSRTLAFSARAEPERYRSEAADLLPLFDDLGALVPRLRLLLAEAASPSPTGASAVPSPSGSPAGSARPTGPNQLADPGFETGVGPPWRLLLGASGAATLTADLTSHAEGAASVRADIASATDERAGVAVVQGGLSLDAAREYTCSFAVRAAATREIVVRVVSSTGITFGTRLFEVGPAWTTVTFDVTPLTSDPSATLEVDLGRSSITTWLDAAYLGQMTTAP
jgi:hypothetical protein